MVINEHTKRKCILALFTLERVEENQELHFSYFGSLDGVCVHIQIISRARADAVYFRLQRSRSGKKSRTGSVTAALGTASGRCSRVSPARAKAVVMRGVTRKRLTVMNKNTEVRERAEGMKWRMSMRDKKALPWTFSSPDFLLRRIQRSFSNTPACYIPGGHSPHLL